jgi:hypothetical protein
MIIREIIKLSNDCTINALYMSDYQPNIAIEYTEHSKDYLTNNTEISIEIDKKKAIEIITFLQKHFKLEKKNEQKTI